jgi:uncharacterized RDD family membrane protein YckC
MSMPPPPPGAPPPPPPPPPPPSGGFYTPAPGVPGGRPLAEPWMRILARFLDGIIASVVFGSIAAAIVLSGDDSAGFGGLGGDVDAGTRFWLVLLTLIPSFLYEAVLTKLFGGTPMKLAFGMRVVQASEGGPIEWKGSIIRWAVPGAFGIVPVIGALASLVVTIVSLVFLFSDKLRQTVSDKVAKTLVVKAR